jgi:hypothetical protein
VTILGFVAIILGFFAIPLALTRITQPKIAYVTLLYLMHIAVSVVVYWRAQANPADSQLYYYDQGNMYEYGFGMGTQAIIYITQYIKTTLGGSYLDFFLLFQTIGFFGIALMLRSFEEIHDELRLPYPPYIYALVTIPSLHCWSRALGKDPPFLLAVSLVLWAAMRLPNRAKALLGGLLLMLLIRPHIALIAVASLSFAVVVGRGIPLYMRVALLIVAASGTGVAVSAIQSAYSIDVTSAESIGQQLERRDNVLQTDDAGGSAVDAPFPIRLLSLWFRPLFFDADELFSLIASFESTFLIYLFIFLLLRTRQVIGLFRNVFFVRYAMFFGVGLTFLLALSYWNVGLGLRQKWSMMMPMYLVLFVAARAVWQARKRGRTLAAAAEAPAYPVVVQPRPAV